MDLTREELEKHLDAHREVMRFIHSRAPQTVIYRNRLYLLHSVEIDADGDIRMKHRLQMSNGDYTEETDYISIDDLFTER